MSIIAKDGLSIIQEKDKVFCDSREIAKQFDKKHDKVLRDINREIGRFDTPNLADEIGDYFIADVYNIRGKEYKRYKLTFEGFQMIVLQYSGDKAFQNRLKFIKLFKYLLTNIAKDKITALANSKDALWLDFREEGKIFRTMMTDAIKEHVVKYREDIERKMNDGRYYQHYTNLVNAKVGLELPKGVNARDVANKRQLIHIEEAEEEIAKLIYLYAKDDIHYKKVYILIKSILMGSTKDSK